MVRRPVRTGDPCTIDHEHDGELVQGDVHDRLVERTRQEGRVDAHDRAHTGHRQPCREGDRVLFADADVEETVGKLLGEVEQPGRRCHGGCDRTNLRPSHRGRHQRFSEHVGVREVGGARPAGQRIEGANSMQLVDLVLDGGAVAVAFLGDHMDHDRGLELFGSREDGLELSFVMAVDDPCVLDAEALEDCRRLQQLLETLLHAIGGLVGGGTHQGEVAQNARNLHLDPFVAWVDAQL